MSLMAMGDAAVLTKRNKYFDVLDFIKAWNFNKSLADDIQKFFAYQIAKDDLGGQQEEEIFQQIPRLLQIDVTRNLYSAVVKDVEIFDGLDKKFLDQLILTFKSVYFDPGVTIMQKDAPVLQLYIVHAGIVEMHKPAEVSEADAAAPAAGRLRMLLAQPVLGFGHVTGSTRTVCAVCAPLLTLQLAAGGKKENDAKPVIFDKTEKPPGLGLANDESNMVC